MADLTLKLAKDILHRNHEMMEETHGKEPETITIMRFSIERGKVDYYELIAL
jgi:hypothetical protein